MTSFPTTVLDDASSSAPYPVAQMISSETSQLGEKIGRVQGPTRNQLIPSGPSENRLLAV